MPLNKKAITYNQKNFLAWLCCLPCVPFAVVTGICVNYCCNNTDIIDLALNPCTDDTLKSKARIMTGNIQASLTSANSPLMKLKIGSRLPEVIFDTLYNNLLSILNAYDFGNISSAKLSDEDVKFMAEQLLEKIVSIIPSLQEFYESVQRRGIAVQNLNAFLAETINDLINMPFLLENLNSICDRNTASVVSVGLFKVTDKTNVTIPEANNLLSENKSSPRSLSAH